ncbi:hypothetical protein [Pseudomonas sp. FH1]|uniref:hypothetical protein n=1 Tax=Pseudomonas sp. FH1 TaxID=1284392 RepID=UPI0003DC3EBA|nr:hypothetical protein [Pseudomonas sp. FH1]ETK24099.1 hypothetical protein H096_07267 [Pseudomonas sp. FH1]
MSLDKNISEEELLLAFSIEEHHDNCTLERYVKKYPQYASALVDCSVEFMLGEELAENAKIQATDSAINKAWSQIETSLDFSPKQNNLMNPFAKLSSSAFREVARKINVNGLFLGRVRDRGIKVSTFPLDFVARLASELGGSVDNMLAYLSSPPNIDSSQSFRSSEKPTASEQISFDEAVETSQLTLTQKDALLALRG